MKRMPEKTQILVARLILCGFVSGALYIFMHELGHGIVAVAAGARVTRFSLIRGFVATSGGHRGYFARQLFYAAGSVFPALSAAVYVLLYRRGGSSTYRIFSALYETVCAASLLDWILTPVLFMAGKAPRGDDCTYFLEFFPFHPMIVSAVTVCVLVLIVLLALKRGVGADFMETVRNHLDNGG